MSPWQDRATVASFGPCFMNRFLELERVLHEVDALDRVTMREVDRLWLPLMTTLQLL